MLTDKAIEKLRNEAKKQKITKQIADNNDKRGVGRLLVRAQPSGNARFWFRYLNAGKWTQIDVGLYHNKGTSGLSLALARLKVEELAILRKSAPYGDLKLHLEQIEIAKQEKEKRQRKAVEDEIKLAREGTLRRLLETYVEHLEKQGKSSARDVKNLFRRNVFEAWPELQTRRQQKSKLAKLPMSYGR